MKYILPLFLFLFLSCVNSENQFEDNKRPVLLQVSVIDALMQGFYDGFYPLSDLKKHGNYGIGTFDALDGEMMFFNDTVFQIDARGNVNIPNDSVLTPFAAVTHLYTDRSFNLSKLTIDSLKNEFDRFFPTPNIFYLIKISGSFSSVHTRSVPAQVRPYAPLAEVTSNQPEFTFENVRGDIIGFYCPHYVKGINVVGFHLHFLTADRTGGGHLINFEMDEGTMEVGFITDYKLILPDKGDFYGGDFSIDRSEELKNVEGLH